MFFKHGHTYIHMYAYVPSFPAAMNKINAQKAGCSTELCIISSTRSDVIKMPGVVFLFFNSRHFAFPFCVSFICSNNTSFPERELCSLWKGGREPSNSHWVRKEKFHYLKSSPWHYLLTSCKRAGKLGLPQVTDFRNVMGTASRDNRDRRDFY